jgi:predicted RNase H-like HicB family nuclease
METGRLAFTAVYLKSSSGYIGFIEELPGVNSHGRTIDEARDTLQKLMTVVFDEEHHGAEELIEGKTCARSFHSIPARPERRVQVTRRTAVRPFLLPHVFYRRTFRRG